MVDEVFTRLVRFNTVVWYSAGFVPTRGSAEKSASPQINFIPPRPMSMDDAGKGMGARIPSAT